MEAVRCEQEAVDRISLGNVDLILSDLRIDREERQRVLDEIARTQGVGLILVVPPEIEDHIRTSFTHRRVAFLRSPLVPERLLECLEQVLCRGRILLVDDDSGIRETLSDILEEEGYAVDVVESGIKAIEHSRTGGYEVALVDILLPDISGLEVLRRMCEGSPWMSVIMISGYGTIENTRQALNEGAYGYVTKPFDLNEVKALLKKAFERDYLAKQKSRLEQQIKETRDYLQWIMANSADMILTTNLEARIVELNRAGEEMLGYKRAELTGMRVEDLYVDQEERAGLLERVTREECIRNYETRLRRKDGGIIDINLTLSLLRDEKGEVIGTVGVSKDIRERKKAEEEIRYLKEYNESILSSMPSSIVILGPDNQVEFVNSCFLDVFGCASEEVLSKPFHEVLSREPMLREKLSGHLQRFQKGLKVKTEEIEVDRKVFSCNFFNVTPSRQDQSRTGIVIRNITEERKLRQQLIQSEKLAGIGTIASGIAHEINNPLSGIMSMSEAILDETDLGKSHEFAGEIVRYAEGASAIVRNLSAYSRSARIGEYTEVNIQQKLEDGLKISKHAVQFEEVEVVRCYALEEGPHFRANSNEIQQVFINLFNNAVQAMLGRGTLTLFTRRFNGFIEVRIGDTGPGISREILPNIFDPFFTTKEVGKGSGLGLNIVYRIVTRYNGYIDVESEEGKGTTFIIRFPAEGLHAG